MFQKSLFVVLILVTSHSFAKKSSDIQYGIFLGNSLSNRSTTPTTASDGFGTYPATLTSEYENSISGGLEIRYLPSDDWLLKGGVRSRLQRKVQTAKLEVLGQSQNLIITNPYSYSLTSAYIDAGYCWESFYIYLGFSHNFFNFKAPGSTVPYRAKNGTGSNFGLGIKITDNWSLEYTGHSASVAVESGTSYQTSDTFLFQEATFTLRFAY